MQKQKAPIPIPASVCGIIGRLNRAGYEAWAVGGSVRDSLLGRTPHDWDLCTSALPEQVAEVFRGERLLPTGLAHGTQTLLEDGKAYEIHLPGGAWVQRWPPPGCGGLYSQPDGGPGPAGFYGERHGLPSHAGAGRPIRRAG